MSDTLSAPVQTAAPVQAPSRRLMSLDALRGFDMFWIVGGEELLHALYRGWPCGFFRLLHEQAQHKAWQGVAFYDLIFPLFVFIVGASLVFSLTRMVEQQGRAAAIRRIIVRSLFLYIFGLLVYGGISKGIDGVRWLGVLQRIALCYLFTGLLFCTVRWRGLVAICASLLLGYWAVTALIPIRDFNLQRAHLREQGLEPRTSEARAAFFATTATTRNRYEDGLNLPQQIDFKYLPGYKWDGAYDPEGLLSTFPAVATCLLGVFAGLLLKNGRVPDQKKVLYLAAAGVAGVVLGFTWGLEFPVIKKIWTSSYVLVAGGYACLFLAAFYQIVEIWQWRRWCTPFIWIGMNPITIYLVAHFVKFEDLANLVIGGPVKQAFGVWGSLLEAVVVVLLMFAFVRFLYKRKIFLRL